MEQARIAFKVLDSDECAPPSYEKIRCHMVFDVKIERFKRKARVVAGRHVVDTPPFMACSSAAGRDSIRIALTISALHDSDVISGDVKNACLSSPVEDKAQP